MHTKIHALFLLILALAMSSNSMAAETSRYRYCNVFADGVCFGIAAGDQLIQTIPIDYTIYEVTLSSGKALTIYNGMNPPRMSGYHSVQEAEGKGWRAKLMQPISGAGSSVFEVAPSGRDVFRITLSRTPDIEAIDFLRNFRICSGGSARGIRCKDEFPLRELAGGLQSN